jgi:hypothetical protein
MPATSERAVHVTAVFFYVQSLQHRSQKDRHVASRRPRVVAHLTRAGSEGQRFEFGREIGILIVTQP